MESPCGRSSQAGRVSAAPPTMRSAGASVTARLRAASVPPGGCLVCGRRCANEYSDETDDARPRHHTARLVRLGPATDPPAPTGPMRPGVLLAAAALAAVAFAAVMSGLVQPPDLEGALTDLSDALGPWTYA